jgi:general secretion pathway protein H
MPTSAAGTSSSRRLRPAGSASRGFTLLELLVVVTIIGIFIGVAVLSTDLAGFERKLEQEANRLRGLLTLVQEEALLQSRDYGILFTEKSYRFYFYDHAQAAWLLPTDDRLLAPRSLSEEMLMQLRLDELAVLLEDEFDPAVFEEPEPQVMILSSGEMSPFELDFLRDDLELGTPGMRRMEKATLIAEFDGTLEISRGTL